MSVTRPHEDRLGTGGASATQVLRRSGTGTAAWGSGGNATVVYAECNSPSAVGSDNPIPWDTFYGNDAATPISGGTLTAALAAIGLTFATNVFTTTGDGIYSLELFYVPSTAPALQSDKVDITTTSAFGVSAQWGVGSVGDNPPQNNLVLVHVAMIPSGGTFRAHTTASGTVSLGVITYAEMSIMKLV